mmetsp:Transcript_56024/g.100698  ORF Transcript_56024/g.100698 Transcript_56024/m.100698 type:complete len:174 (+) Transcript_56024:1-522(+)
MLEQKDADAERMLKQMLEQKDADTERMLKELEKKSELLLESEKKRLEEKSTALQREVLRVQGLLTASGVFERVAQIVWDEQGIKGRFNCQQALNKAANNPGAGSWSQFLFDSVKQCVPKANVNDELTKVWGSLSTAVHTEGWSDLEVKYIEKLDENGQCLLRKLCSKMGLPYT